MTTRRQFIYELKERADANGAAVTPRDTDSCDLTIDPLHCAVT
jgi:hypothetical protein